MSNTPHIPGDPDAPESSRIHDPDAPVTAGDTSTSTDAGGPIGGATGIGGTAGARPAHTAPSTGPVRLLAILVIVGGVIMSIAGAVTWVIVTTQLSDEKIVVAEDADNFAGEKVDGPLTAYAQADIINEHALEETDGQTYAQLDREDPRRDTVMTASFLRASLFTSVVAFGVAAFAFGLGLLLILIGLALLRVEKRLRTAW